MTRRTLSEEIEVTFDGEVLRPEEPLDLPPNTKYRVRLEAVEKQTPTENSLLRILETASDMGVSDLAEQHDHYLYGTPKK